MSVDLEAILEEVEKNAGLSEDFARIPGGIRAAWRGAKGFVGGMRNVADEHRAVGALRRVAANPHAAPEAVAQAQELMKNAPVHTQNNGLFSRMAAEVRGGAAQARDAWHKSKLESDAETLKNLRPNVAEATFAPPSAAATQSAGTARQAVPNPWTDAPAQAPQQSFLQRHGGKMLGAGALGMGGYAAYRASQQAAEQDTRATDYMANALHNPATPMPSMTVMASYEAYGKEVTGAVGSGGELMGKKFFEGVGGGVGSELASKAVAEPLGALQRMAKRHLMDEPKWKQNFQQAVDSDPELQEAYKKHPEKMQQVFNSVKRFGPSIAKDPLGTQSILRHAMTADHNLDWSTLKAIAEIEKFHNEAKRTR